MRAVNLLPRDEPRQSFGGKSTRLAVGGTVGFVLVSVLLAASMLSASGSVSEKESTLDSLRGSILGVVSAMPPPDVAASAAEAQLSSEKSQRIAALAGALGGRVAWDRILRQVSLVLPDDVWLTSLSATSPAEAAAAAQGSPAAAPLSSFVLSGATYSQPSVARLLSRLAVVPDLANVALESSATQSIGEKKVVQFTIRAGVKADGAAS